MPRKNAVKPAVDPIQTLGKCASFASFGLFVIIGINYVDARYEYTRELSVQEDLIAQDSEQQQRLDQFHADSERMGSQLSEFEKRAISEAELSEVQDQLLSLAKEHNCTIKKASPRGVLVREFTTSKPTGLEANVNDPNRVPGTVHKEFEIHDAGLALNIEGELKATLDFLETVKKQPWFTSTRQLVLRRDPSQPSRIATELELRFASLHQVTDHSK